MGKLPLDSQHWFPLKAAVDLLVQQTGDLGAAFLDLQQDLENDKLGYMRRHRASNKREHGAASDWKPRVIDLSRLSLGSSAPTYKTTQQKVADIYHHPDRGDWLHYIWKPHFDKLYGGGARADADSDSPSSVRPGPKYRGDWPTLVAQWLIEVAADDPKRLQNVDALVVEANLFLGNQIGWSPSDTKDLRAKIVELLKRVRR